MSPPEGLSERELHFYEEVGCYVVRWLSDFSQGSLARHWAALVEDPRLRPGMAALHDARGCQVKAGRSALGEGARLYRREVEPRVGFGRVALLVDDDGTLADARRLTELLELEGALVTTSESEAKAWVGLERNLPLPYRPSQAHGAR